MNDDAPVTAEELLLQASLERPLSPAEKQQLISAIQHSPELANDAATLGLLRALRLDRRISQHDAQAWAAFSQLAKASANAGSGHSNPRWKEWLTTWIATLRPAAPALAVLVIVVQAGGLVWMNMRDAQQNRDDSVMRGGVAAICPAVLVRFKPTSTAVDVTRVLTQAQADVVAGPDVAGFYRLAGPQGWVGVANAILADVAVDVKLAPDCSAMQ